MARLLHNVGGKLGFTDGTVDYLSGLGLPGGDAAYQDAASVGAYYSRSDGRTYKKISIANNSVADWDLVPNTVELGNVSTVANNALLAANSATTTANNTQLALSNHVGDLANPHAVTAVQVGAIPLAEKGAVNGVATLVGGVVPTSQIPAVAITTVTPVIDLAAMLALVAQSGDVAVRADLTAAAGNTFMHNGGTAGTIADWTLIDSGYAVASVNGQTGTVVLAAADVGADVAGSAATVQGNLNTTNLQVNTNTNDILSIVTNGAQNHNVVVGHTAGIVDTVATSVANGFRWIISARDAIGNSTEMIAIMAIHDGVNVDYDEDGLLELGPTLNSAVSLAIVAGNLELSVSYNAAVDIGIMRERI